MGLLIDSTFLIRAERSRLTPDQLIARVLDHRGDVPLAISVMSAGELLHGCWRADNPARRSRRESFVESVLAVLPVVAVTLPVMRVYAELDAKLRSTGRRMPISDLLIASTALARGDQLLTANVRHFDRVAGLVVYNEP